MSVAILLPDVEKISRVKLPSFEPQGIAAKDRGVDPASETDCRIWHPEVKGITSLPIGAGIKLHMMARCLAARLGVQGRILSHPTTPPQRVVAPPWYFVPLCTSGVLRRWECADGH